MNQNLRGKIPGSDAWASPLTFICAQLCSSASGIFSAPQRLCGCSFLASASSFNKADGFQDDGVVGDDIPEGVFKPGDGATEAG